MRPRLHSALLQQHVQNQLTMQRHRTSVAAALYGNLKLHFFTATSWLGSISEVARELDIPKKAILFIC